MRMPYTQCIELDRMKGGAFENNGIASIDQTQIIKRRKNET